MEVWKFTRIVLALSLLVTLLLFLLSFGKPNEVCYSKGGRFLPYHLHGKAPKKVSDLSFCRMFIEKTCCDSKQTHSTLLAAGKITSLCISNLECGNLWQFLECSICDPKIGVRRGAPLICSSFCDRIYSACSDAYFARDGSGMKPCDDDAQLVCAKVSSLFSNGSELCYVSGFSVLPDVPGIAGEYCYGSEVVDSYYSPWHSSKKWEPIKSEQTEEMKDYEDAPSRVTKTEASAEDTSSRLMKFMVLGKHVLYQAWKSCHDRRVYCAVGVVGLSAWLFFLRFRKSVSIIEKAKSFIDSIEKPDAEKPDIEKPDIEKLDAEPKGRNRRSRKRKNG